MSDEKNIIAKLDDMCWVTKRVYKNVALVDIRKMYKDSETQELKPGRQGISLTPPQWTKLIELKDDINAAFKDMKKDEYSDEWSAEISKFKRASVQKWKGKLYIDLREFYEKDNEMRPGKKGVKLSFEMWSKLCESMVASSSSAEEKKKRDRDDVNETREHEKKRVKLENLTKKDDIHVKNNTSPDKVTDSFNALNAKGTRRFTKRVFKNILLYDIREYYESSSGEMLPGRKGISLKEEQWKILLSQADTVNELLTSSRENDLPSCFLKNKSDEIFLELSKNSSSHDSRVER